jgi:hypothetical protein
MSWRDFAIRKGSTIKTVNADGTGDYTKLSDALAAISDASSSKRYTVIVIGVISDTATVVRKSYIDVIGFNAIVNITSNSVIHGVSFTSIVYSEWRDLEFHRIGSGFSGDGVFVDCLEVTGCDSTCRTVNCKFLNDATGSNQDSFGINMVASNSSAYFRDCHFKGGTSDHLTAHVLGGRVKTTSSATFKRCKFEGGTGNFCIGLESSDKDNSTYEDCEFLGVTKYGIYICHGFYTAGAEVVATFSGCSAIGYDFGCIIDTNRAPIIQNFRCVATKSNGYGIEILDVAAPIISGLITNGIYVSQNAYPSIQDFICVGGIIVSDRACPRMRNGIAGPKHFSDTWIYTSADSGRFRSVANTADSLRLKAIDMYIQNIAGIPAGTTMKIGTTPGGSEIANAVLISGLSYGQSFTFVEATIAAGSYMYMTPSVAIAEGALCLNFIEETIGSYALQLSSSMAASFTNVFFRKTPTSNSIYLQTAAINAGLYKFMNCTIEGLYAQIADTGEQFVNCAFTTAPTNLTDVGGTTNYSEMFLDLAAASVDGVHAAIQNLSGNHNDVVSPLHSRIITITQAGSGTPLAGTVRIYGYNSIGLAPVNPVYDLIIVSAANGTYSGAIPFSVVTGVVGFDAGADQTLSVGWGDKIGMSKQLQASANVLKIIKNGAALATPAVDAVNNSIDFSDIVDGDDITVLYRTPKSPP